MAELAAAKRRMQAQHESELHAATVKLNDAAAAFKQQSAAKKAPRKEKELDDASNVRPRPAAPKHEMK